MKKNIRLTESDLRSIIEQEVKRALNEGSGFNVVNAIYEIMQDYPYVPLLSFVVKMLTPEQLLQLYKQLYDYVEREYHSEEDDSEDNWADDYDEGADFDLMEK